ncbi:MAG: SBBP repeat-containing protein [Bacteroidetes bacterium]|nr:SBBP repeat-containing protein [Bacteroidota bacterium]
MENKSDLITTIILLATFCLAPTLSIAENSGKHGRFKKEHSQFSHNMRGNPSAPHGLNGAGMNFTPNKGQIADMNGKFYPDVLYKGAGAGADVYLRKTGISYVYCNIGEVIHDVNEQIEELINAGTLTESDEQKKKDELMQSKSIKVHRVDMDFEDCNSSIKPANEDEIDGYNNYYYAHCPNGVLNIKQYNKVTYKNIYNNIDVIYYGDKQNGIKYDLIIQPHADPGQIKLRWKGAENININREGNLEIKTSVNKFYESIPKVYQNINGKIVDVKAKYKLDMRCEMLDLREKSNITKNSHISCLKSHIYEVTFELGTWNPEFPLVIDPWASYYGGTTFDWGHSVTTDPSGNCIFTGQASSLNFPVSAGAFQTTYGGGGVTAQIAGDAFMVKMDINGIRQWATYYGGSDDEHGADVATDAAGNSYITGPTKSANFPVISGHQMAMGGSRDAFLLKFNVSGARVWATYYGGSGGSTGFSVCTDGNNVYMGGATSSPSAISTAGSFQPVLNGIGDAFVVKFDSNCNRIWGTYLGGSNQSGEGVYSIAYDVFSGNVYAGGVTYSSDFPVGAVPGNTVHQPVFGGSGAFGLDAFLVKFSPTGARLWSTFYGGTGYETYYVCITTDLSGNVILGATTNSTSNIASLGAYQATLTESNNGFIAKFNTVGIRQWATYIRGGGVNWGNSIANLATDINNNIYVAGEFEDNPAGYPLSTCAIQSDFGGAEDAFIAKYNPAGVQTCLTYVGGLAEDDIEGGNLGIAINGNNLYLTGTTYANGYPVTAGAFQTVFGGVGTYGYDVYINQLCINLCEAKTLGLNYTSSTTSVCRNMPVIFTPIINYSCDTTGYKFKWSFTGGSPSSSVSQNPSITYAVPGSYPVQLTLTTACKKDSVLKTSYIIVNPCACPLSAQASTLNNVTCNGLSNGAATATGSGGTGAYTYSWSNGQNTSTISGLRTGTYVVTTTDANGCSYSAQTTLTEPQATIISGSSTNSSCAISSSATVSITSGIAAYTYNWSNGATTQTVSGLAPGSYTVTVTNGIGCPTTQTFNISNTSPFSATFTNPPACVGKQVCFTNTGSTGSGINHTWLISPITPTNVSGTTTNFCYTFLTSGTYSIEHTVTNGSCFNRVKTLITTTNCNVPTVTANGSTVCPGTCATITSSGAGSTGPYTYSWNTGATSQNINPCPAITTTYTVTIKDTGGNTSSSTAVVTVNPAVTVTVSPTNISCNAGTNGSAIATGGSGTPGYTYNWSNLVSGSTVSGLTSGNYSVTVTDTKGCTAVTTTTITSPPPLAGQFAKGTANCTKCGCKEWIMVNATGGTSPYSYSWPDGYLNRYKSQLCPGPYTIYIKDKNGCSINVSLGAP